MNSEAIKDYLFDRREGFVNRWHTEPTIRSESLAEHTFFVARNTLFMCQVLRELNIEHPDFLLAVNLALHHDEAEKIIGDMPGTAKRDYPILKEAITKAEHYALYDHVAKPLGREFVYRHINWLDFPEDFRIEDTLEVQIVKYCDILDAHIFAKLELRLGNTMLTAASRTGEWMQVLEWPWLQELRKEIDLP